MTEYDDEDDWPRDPASAVALLRLHLLFKHLNRNRDPETVTLPRDIAQIVLECAQKGLHKGRGRRGVPLSHSDKLRQNSIVHWAKSRKAELQAANPNMSAVEAALQAADEAETFLLERYGLKLKASTIKRRMERKE
jgi:hypothetical protein